MTKRLTLCLLFIALLAGCKRHKKERIFAAIQAEPHASFHQKQNNITCMVKKLTAQEEWDLFGDNLSLVDIHPFYLEIINHSSDVWYFSARHISAPLASDGMVKDSLHKSQSHAWTASLLAAIYCWPLIPVVIAPIAWWTYLENKDKDRFIEDHSVRAHERFFYIAPHERIKKLVCIYGWQPGTIFDLAITRDKDGFVSKFTVGVA